MSQRKKPFGLDVKVDKRFIPKTPGESARPKIKLTPMSSVKNSKVPNILDDNEFDWMHRKQRSYSPSRSSSPSPSLPVPTKSDVNMIGFTPNAMYNMFCFILFIFSLLCLAAADSIQQETSNTENFQVLYFLAGISALVLVFMLVKKFICH